MNEKEKWIFFHVPKAAGTSIANALHLAQNTNHFPYTHFEKFAPRRYIDSFMTFAFVREPIDRFCSLYTYAQMEESHYHSAKSPETAIHGKHMDYDSVKDIDANECVEMLVEGKLKHFSGKGNFWYPQFYWISNSKGTTGVAAVYSVRDTAQAVIDLRQHRGVSIGDIPKLNRSNSNKVRSSLSPNSLSLLEAYYKKDYEHYQHLF